MENNIRYIRERVRAYSLSKDDKIFHQIRKEFEEGLVLDDINKVDDNLKKSSSFSLLTLKDIMNKNYPPITFSSSFSSPISSHTPIIYDDSFIHTTEDIKDDLIHTLIGSNTNFHLLQYFIDRLRVNVNSIDKNNQNILMKFIELNNFENKSLTDEEDKGKIMVINYIIKSGIQLDYKDSLVRNILHYIILYLKQKINNNMEREEEKKILNIIKNILFYNNNLLLSPDKFSLLPLHYSIIYHQYSIYFYKQFIQLSIQFDSSISSNCLKDMLNLRDSNGNNSLYLAILHKREDLVEYLIDSHGYLLNFSSKNNNEDDSLSLILSSSKNLKLYFKILKYFNLKFLLKRNNTKIFSYFFLLMLNLSNENRNENQIENEHNLIKFYFFYFFFINLYKKKRKNFLYVKKILVLLDHIFLSLSSSQDSLSNVNNILVNYNILKNNFLSLRNQMEFNFISKNSPIFTFGSHLFYLIHTSNCFCSNTKKLSVISVGTIKEEEEKKKICVSFCTSSSNSILNITNHKQFCCKALPISLNLPITSSTYISFASSPVSPISFSHSSLSQRTPSTSPTLNLSTPSNHSCFVLNFKPQIHDCRIKSLDCKKISLCYCY